MPPKKAASGKREPAPKSKKKVIDLTQDNVSNNPVNAAKRKRFTPEEEVSELKSSLSSFMQIMKVDSEQVNNLLSDKPPKRTRKAVERYQDENFVQLMSREDDEVEKDLIGSEGEDYDSSSVGSGESAENSEISVISNDSYKPQSESESDEELDDEDDDDDNDDEDEISEDDDEDDEDDDEDDEDEDEDDEDEDEDDEDDEDDDE